MVVTCKYSERLTYFTDQSIFSYIVEDQHQPPSIFQRRLSSKNDRFDANRVRFLTAKLLEFRNLTVHV